MLDDSVRAWAELMVEAVLDKRDPQSILDGAAHAGVDLDELHRLVDVILKALRRRGH